MPVGDIYVWQARSFTVRLSLPMVDRLRSALARMAANEEHGGILLGWIIDPATVEVTGCEFFPSAHRKGTLYDLGAHERERVAMRARELARVKSIRPVGYFRTHQRPGLFLDQDDFALMEDAFRETGSVALLIRPRSGDAPDAGFFFWESGDLDRKQTQLVFPFDSAALRARGPVVTPIAPVSAGTAPLPKPWIPAVVQKHYRTALLSAGAAILSFATVALLLKSGPVKPASANPFDLRIARSGESLVVDWNRDAPALRNVSSASLTIEDNGVAQKLTLDRAELGHGSVQFWPQSNHVVVRMDVTNSREISESVTAVVEGGENEAVANNKAAPSAPVNASTDAPPAVSRRSPLPNIAPDDAYTEKSSPGGAESAGNSTEESSTRSVMPKTRAWRSWEQPSKPEGHPANEPPSGSQPMLTASALPASSGAGNSAATPAPGNAAPSAGAPPQAKPMQHVLAVAIRLEPRPPSEMHRVMSRIPLVGHFGNLRYHGGETDFQPPQPEHSLEPKVPPYMMDNLKAPVDVTVLVSIDKKGKVRGTEVLEGAGTGFGSLAADRAASVDWTPGKVGDKAVASQVVARYHFRTVEKEAADAQASASR